MAGSVVATNLDGLVTIIDDASHLLGTRCRACATDTFPSQASCPRCGAVAMDAVALPTQGMVWTWTVQRFAPKPPFRAPKVFEPFALAYVDLGTIRVEARLAGRAVDAWKIGDAVKLVVGPLDESDPGWDAFWFEPESVDRVRSGS